MRVLGIETSCDETGLAVYDTERGLVAHALHSQVAMHEAYGGVVPELASRDHVRRVVPLAQKVLAEAGLALADLDGIACTTGPGLAGALLVGASVAHALGFALGKPVVDVHHLEGHLLSPLLADPRPTFPFVALLVSGGHTQFHEVAGVGRYRLLGESQDDAAGEAFDKTAKLLGLGYPGGPALARLAEGGRAGAVSLPRPMHDSGDLDMSFSGLEDRGADARPARSRGRNPGRRAQGRHRPRVPDAPSSTCWSARRSAALAHDRPRAAGRRRRRRRQPRAARAPVRRRCANAAARSSFPIRRSAPTTAR